MDRALTSRSSPIPVTKPNLFVTDQTVRAYAWRPAEKKLHGFSRAALQHH